MDEDAKRLQVIQQNTTLQFEIQRLQEEYACVREERNQLQNEVKDQLCVIERQERELSGGE